MIDTIQKIYLDLDRTIFNTAKFFEQLWDIVGVIHSTDTTTIRTRAKNFFSYQGDLYNYRFYEHLKAEDLLVNHDVLIQKLRSQYTFIYDDVIPAWPYLQSVADTAILTYGGTDYQKLKIACCPELDNIKITIVLEPKAAYFAREMCDIPVLLIDDKNLAAELPESVKFIQVRRSDTTPFIKEKGYIAINSFAHVKEAISLL